MDPARRRQRPPCWRRLAGTALVLLSVIGCTPGTSGPLASPSSQLPSRSASSEPTPVYDLTAPGHARTVVNFLADCAGINPIIRVEVTRSSANLTYVEQGKAHTIGFANGQVNAVDSSVEYINQASFNPADFNLDDVGTLFRLAAQRSGSSQQQDLQINEYQPGEILMTVTTTPESTTVFFQPNGTPIDELDYRTAAGLAEGLRDTARGSQTVLAVGYKPDEGLWVDVRVDATTIERRTRQAGLPTIVTRRTQTTSLMPFDPAIIDTVALARLLNEAAATLGKPPTTPVSVTIDRHDPTGALRMYVDVGTAQLITDPAGNVVALR